MREIVSDGTEWGGEDWYEARWNSIPEETQTKIIDRLRTLEPLDEIVQAIDDRWFHMTTGMGVRNYLRQVVQDDELPDAPYPDGRSYRNWDDYYITALRKAAV